MLSNVLYLNKSLRLISNDLIDITDLIEGREDEDFLSRILAGEEDLLFGLYQKLREFKKYHPESFYSYFRNLYNDHKYYFVDHQIEKKSIFVVNVLPL